MTTPTTRRRYGAILACGAVLALAACGGGDDEPASAGDLLEDLQSGDLDPSDLEELLDDLGDEDLGDLEDLGGNVDLGDAGGLGDLGDLFGDEGGLSELDEIFGEGGLEALIEEQTGGEVDIEFGEDGFSFESEDGGITFDEDGNFTVTDEDGNETTGEVGIGDDGFSVESDDGSFGVESTDELPEDWPASVPEPDGLAIQQVTSINDDTTVSFTVAGTFDGDHRDWVGTYGGDLEDAGFARDSYFESGDDVNSFYTGDGFEVFVNTSSVVDPAMITITLISVDNCRRRASAMVGGRGQPDTSEASAQIAATSPTTANARLRPTGARSSAPSSS